VKAAKGLGRRGRQLDAAGEMLEGAGR